MNNGDRDLAILKDQDYDYDRMPVVHIAFWEETLEEWCQEDHIPFPDHRIPPDSKWENVQYDCEQMQQELD